VFHLLDEDNALGPPCPVGSTIAPYTRQMFQDASHYRGRAYIISSTLIDGGIFDVFGDP